MPTTVPITLSALRSKLTLPVPDQLNAARRKLATTAEVDGMLNRNAVVAVGISSGKDGTAAALATARYLDEIGHSGPRVLVHADLGRVEWRSSMAECERLAAHMGWELIVVRRKAGDLLQRWMGRWKSNVRRYAELECVKLILPWSTPKLRYCTGEFKAKPIASELRKRFPTQEILNVTGIRRQESSSRAKAPVSKVMTELTRKGAAGVTWNSVIDWPIEDVLQEISDAGLPLHEAYTVYGTSRVSCVFCVMGSWADLVASTTCADNHEVYVSMCELEADSGFGFQGNRWLSDVAPHLLTAELRAKVAASKTSAARRVELEKQIPKHMEYEKGWPTQMPTAAEAEMLAQVRRGVAQAVGLEVKYPTGPDILARYQELMRIKMVKDAKKKKAPKNNTPVATPKEAVDQKEDQFALF